MGGRNGRDEKSDVEGSSGREGWERQNRRDGKYK